MIHELNNLTYETYDIDTYFNAMDITEEQKEVRKEAADDLWDEMLFLFMLMQVMNETGGIDYNALLLEFRKRYTEVVEKYSRIDYYTENYINDFTQNTVDSTMRNMNPDKEDDYWTSPNRALGLALNESNSILNYEELQKAIDAGFTHKKWVAERDRKTREDHIYMDGREIEIADYFVFPDCLMLMPHDEVNGTARQNANCRCSLKYLDRDGSRYNSPVNNRTEDIIASSRSIARPFESSVTRGTTFNSKKASPDIKRENADQKAFVDINPDDMVEKWKTMNKVVEIDGNFVYQGKIYRVDGHNVKYEPTQREREVAQILVDQFGGIVELMPKIHYPQNVRTPDYLFRGQRYDLKALNEGTSARLLRDKVKIRNGKMAQAENVIFDITNNTKMSWGEINSQAESIFLYSDCSHIETVMLLRNDKVERIIKRLNSFSP